MDHKGRLRRLDQLYADIDLPALNPAGHPLEVSQAPENLPIPRDGESLDVILLPQIEPFDMAVPDGVEEALPLLPDPLPDVIVLPQTERVEAAESNGMLEAMDAAALPLLAEAVSNANMRFQPEQDDVAELAPTTEALDVEPLPVVVEPVPIRAASQLPAEKQVAKSGLQPPKANGTRQPDWKALLIGVVTGTLLSGIIVLVTSQMNIFSQPGRLVLWSGEMFLGMVGALLANSWKSTTRELWRAALTWTLYPVWFALLIGLIYLLLTFTSLTG